jgi:hypothetical protein
MDKLLDLIMLGKSKEALELAKPINRERLRVFLKKILFQKIGIANPELVIMGIKDNNLARLLAAECISPKSTLCDDLLGAFMNCDFIEPFPNEQHTADPVLGIKTAASMYWKGMDVVFWNLIRQKTQKLAQLETIRDPRAWIFAWFYTHYDMPKRILKLPNTIPFKETKKLEEFVKWCVRSKHIIMGAIGNIDRRNPPIDTQYFTVGMDNVIKFLENEPLIPPKQYDEVVVRNTPNTAIKLYELGTLQCTISGGVYDTFYPMFCWLQKGERVMKYVIKCFTTKKGAKLAYQADNNIAKFPGNFICRESKIICLRQYIEHLNIIDTGTNDKKYVGNIKFKKLYCTIAETLQGFPIGAIRDLKLERKDLNVIKYIKYIHNATTHMDDVIVVTNQKKGPIFGICCNNITSSSSKICPFKIDTASGDFLKQLKKYSETTTNEIYIKSRLILTHFRL